MNQRHLKNKHNQQGEHIPRHTIIEIVLRNRGVIPRPELVEVVEGREEEREEEGHADNAGDQPCDVQDCREAAQFGRRCQYEKNEEEDGAGAELEGIVYGDADGFVVEGVDGGDGDGDWGLRGREERYGLEERVERRHGDEVEGS